MSRFNEDSRVKIPAILHLMRLGYSYHSLKGQTWDVNTNIFPKLFSEAICKINPDLDAAEAGRLLEEVKLSLDNEDLGKAFYEKLTSRSGRRLIDFDNFNNNSFHVVTELTCQNGDEEFRPDITLLINGMPLVFIEVKKPNNPEGILAERERINRRCANPKFRRFINATQLMIFSNNMEYDESGNQPLQGAFYASASYQKPIFNYFREEEQIHRTLPLKDLSDEQEIAVLKDNNYEVIRQNPEFLTNKDPSRPTSRICTSLLSRERLSFMLQYSLAYVHESDGLQKHVMRYPQIFATKAVENKLRAGVKKGIIWHTQGSGKTSLAYYNVRHLTDYFQRQQIIPKFYFIVDRIDLLLQAQREFSSRGLIVHTIDSRDEFAAAIKATQVLHNFSGQPEITVVNIQKFQDDPDVLPTQDYSVQVQRVYFLDEVHRSYNPAGSFLANLELSDRQAIKIGLTGTPLLGNAASKLLFGDYIHKYYYDASIKDGYTLRLIREEIATNYKIVLKEALEQIELEQGAVDRKLIYSHTSFVQPMLDYILTDFNTSRRSWNDNSIGAMVICDSSEQAKEMYRLFMDRRKPREKFIEEADVAFETAADVRGRQGYLSSLKTDFQANSAALILHDVGSKEERKAWVEDFKAGKIDLLIVYNMLLTGFDAKRLKKLYLGRVIRKQNLLQALTRVNRTYKNFRYGYVVDFADIRKEFDATNKAYFDELQSELGDEMKSYSQLFKSQEEVMQDIAHIKDLLFPYDISNAEIFSQQISTIEDRETVLALKKALADAKSLYNILRLQGDSETLKQLDFQQLNRLYTETSNHLDLLNLKESMEQGQDTSNLLKLALEDIIFKFTKIGEEELVLADQLKNVLRQTREAFASNFDPQDPKFISLKDELERIFREKKLSEVTQQEMNENIGTLRKIHERIKELNRQNKLLQQKYQGDVKFARIHKRLQDPQTVPPRGLSGPESRIFKALSELKQQADAKVLENHQILDNEAYFERLMVPLVINSFTLHHPPPLPATEIKVISRLVVTEYLKAYHGDLAS